MQNIKTQSFKNRRVLLRVDFNVPLNDYQEITDISRINAAIPTIEKVIVSGGIPIIISHLGRPKGKDSSLSLYPVAKKLAQILNKNVIFLEDCIGEKVKSKINNSVYEEVYLLENLRFYKEETVGDVAFAKELASLADFYINDAFGTSHRAHASTYGVAQFFKKNRFCGLLLEKEISSLNSVFKNPIRPVTAVIGGAKISSKIDVLISLLNSVDKLIVGGGMAYTFIAAKKGEVGKSLVEDNKIQAALEIIKKAKENNVSLILPIDSVNSTTFNNQSASSVSEINKIPANEMGLDIGPKSIDLFSKEILSSKTILWNGPMGVFEFSNFSEGTLSVGKSICESTEKGAFSLVGGGDSIAAIKKFNLTNGISYISTGGGAMLEYLEGKELPALKALL
ncbi:MAG: phosphoglycerate kinase [Pelagibacterales bacterium]|nr:phosphoglycerate kinase [Pelagibacterales bacterium]